ncbi:SusD/RagB family nutrient-binding outer membrane lipoprotein [Danxiaibacter flavus]|uniref:SusD/RagB family nutrient-binding outer membrane lipoprotein n=1 Tax=Danxiaibacter flavus TaxID=3049108 RepID=A0ABV3ZBJ4_9BACT|nr:SusD/RagB family nutrient-binding outer membrane lipoprotein [Chitinophagaceae bacterium DXS]
MQRIYKKANLLTTALALLLFTGCTKDFESISENPNNPVVTEAVYFMTKEIVSTCYDYQSDAYMDKPASAGRYITMVRNEGNDNFGWTAASWDGHYLRLTTNKSLHDQAALEQKEQYVAISKIFYAFNFSYISDLYGDIPYTDALHSKDLKITLPKYDQQQDVYPSLIKLLKEANDSLATTTKSIDKAADVLYAGDILKWRKFANSLRLRLLLRCSKTYASAVAEMQEIAGDPSKYPVFTSNSDNAELPYTTIYKWPGGPTGGGGALTDPFAEFIKRKPSKEIVDFMTERSDPRMPVLLSKVTGDPADATVDHNDYVGVPNSISLPYAYNGGDEHISTLNLDIFYQDQNPLVNASLMTYSEVCFILAEAAQQKGVTVSGKTAESLYYEGIKANMDYWHVSADAQTAYKSVPTVVYDGTLKQLIGQKWLALFIKGAEGWFDYRRTNDILGFDQKIGPVAAQHTIPKRYIYPDGERNLNRAEYDKAIAIFGEDTRNTLMWYLK